MTELCDWFKVWFAHRADLVDPASGQVIVPRGPDAAWTDSLARFPGQSLSLAFAVAKPESLGWPTIAEEFAKAGFNRAFAAGRRIRLTEDEIPADAAELLVIQDRVLRQPDTSAGGEGAAEARLGEFFGDGRPAQRFRLGDRERERERLSRETRERIRPRGVGAARDDDLAAGGIDEVGAMGEPDFEPVAELRHRADRRA